MNDKEKKSLGIFIKKMVKEAPVEKPSLDFSANVMDAINALEAKKTRQVYEPLISKKIWFLIVAGIIALTVYLFKTGVHLNEGYLSKVDLSKITNAISFDSSYSFNISNTALYGFIFLAIMIPIQIAYLKRYHDKKFS